MTVTPLKRPENHVDAQRLGVQALVSGESATLKQTFHLAD